jgi:hypothetical protein
MSVPLTLLPPSPHSNVHVNDPCLIQSACICTYGLGFTGLAECATCAFVDLRRETLRPLDLPDVVSGAVGRRELQPEGSFSPEMAGGTTPQAWQVRACRSPPPPYIMLLNRILGQLGPWGWIAWLFLGITS